MLATELTSVVCALGWTDVFHDPMFHVEHLLMCGLVITLSSEEVIPPDRHVAAVGRRAIELSIHRPDDLLRRESATIADSDFRKVGRLRHGVGLYWAVSGRVHAVTTRKSLLDERSQRLSP